MLIMLEILTIIENKINFTIDVNHVTISIINVIVLTANLIITSKSVL